MKKDVSHWSFHAYMSFMRIINIAHKQGIKKIMDHQSNTEILKIFLFETEKLSSDKENCACRDQLRSPWVDEL